MVNPSEQVRWTGGETRATGALAVEGHVASRFQHRSMFGGEKGLVGKSPSDGGLDW